MHAACWLLAHIFESPLVIPLQLLAAERAMAEIHVDIHRLALVGSRCFDDDGVADLDRHVWVEANVFTQPKCEPHQLGIYVSRTCQPGCVVIGKPLFNVCAAIAHAVSPVMRAKKSPQGACRAGWC
ncbi:hypothetical protein [Comamonas testosteroni]|uniref:hypothetical protein n=1 Tax=Comamonas testosteroni TaxID=285 RepID=UPI0015F96D93|nr:hypothetical protein [Comamonas testosteroni]